MNEQRERKGPNPALLLLIPAALIIAKGASRRRAMRGAAWGGPGGFGPGGFGPGRGHYGHHGQFGAGYGPGDRSAEGMPPWIEQKLEAWHTKAHEQGDAAEPTTAV
jgi:hypothetical protein